MVWMGQPRLSLPHAPRGMLQAGKTPRRPPKPQTPGKNKCDEFWACPRPWGTSELPLGPISALWVRLVRVLDPTDSHRESHWLRGGCCLSSQIAWHMMSVLWGIHANQTSRERSEISCFPWAAAIPGQVCVNQQEPQNLPDKLFLFGGNFLPSCLQKASQWHKSSRAGADLLSTYQFQLQRCWLTITLVK